LATNSMAVAAGSAAVDGAQNAKPLLAAGPPDIGSREMFALIRELVRPYTGWLVIVLIAMLIETAMSLASPWPLKVVIDSVLGSQPLPEWLRGLRDFSVGDSKVGLALVAGTGVVLIAVVGAIATYVDNYYTESVGQWVANDLRIRIYDHLQRMSLSYFDKEQTGTMLSTIKHSQSTG
jgi:ABC-type multidrug transport system fused ATPase/permease subunit